VKTTAGDGRLQRRADFQNVMNTPHLPHALGEVGIEVAVEDGVAGSLVPVAGTAVDKLVGVPGAGTETLGVEVVRVIVVRIEQPLVVVLVEDVLLAGTCVNVAHLDELAGIAVMHVRRIVREQRVIRFRSGRRAACQRGLAVLEAEVGRDIRQLGYIAHRKRGEEKFFVIAINTIVRRSDAQTAGNDLTADAAGTVVDHERITHTVQRMSKDGILEP